MADSSTEMRRVALAIDDHDWHARALIAALAARNAETVAFRLGDAAFDSTAASGLDLPEFHGALPDAVLVRAISGGSFEEVTRRLGLLHALRELGVPVWNDARAVERCVDKSTTGFLLARAGVATPSAWAVEGRDAACVVVRREAGSGPLVLKPLFGSQGHGLRLVTCEDDLPNPVECGGVYYLQRYVPPFGGLFHDYRLFVCAGEVVASMTRHSETWITNIRQGARAEPIEPDAVLTDLAVRAGGAIGVAYAGVDILRDRNGHYWVLEVNSMPGWRGLQRVTEHSIADRIASALLASLR